MNTFGNIKTNIETAAANLVKSSDFKRFIFEFDTLVIKNKDLCELYHIYDDLSSNKAISTDIVNDYINESIEYSQILIEDQLKNINHLNIWIRSWNKTKENNYSDIDNAIYTTGIKNLESILESKKKIMNTLVIKNKKTNVTEKFILPLSTTVKIAEQTLKKELDYLNENDKKELNEVLKLNGDQLKLEFLKVKKVILQTLKTSLNESTENNLVEKLSQTIEKIKNSNCNHYEYYKLKKLQNDL